MVATAGRAVGSLLSGRLTSAAPYFERFRIKHRFNNTKATNIMKIAKQDIPVRLDVPGATARQELNFGNVSGYGEIAGEYFSLKQGTDIAPLLKGLGCLLYHGRSSLGCGSPWVSVSLFWREVG